MRNKLIGLICLGVLLNFAANVSAAVWWYGTVDDNWNNPNNYNLPGEIPPTGPDMDTGINWGISGRGGVPAMKLDTGETGYCASYWSYAELSGTYEAVVYIRGGDLISANGFTAGSIGTGHDSTVYLSSGSVSFPAQTRIGRVIFGGSGGTGKIHMTGGTWSTGSLQIPYETSGSPNGILNLYDGTMTASSLTMLSGGYIDIEQGTLKISGDVRDDIAPYITSHWIEAYGGAGELQVDYDGGYTTVTAVNPAIASEPYPSDDSAGAPVDVTLTWLPGIWANKHTVYFGTSESDVNEGSTPISVEKDANSHGPLALNRGQKYYWRIDEVNTTEPNTWQGNIWNFTVREFAIVDDMESYNDDFNLIIFTWMDGTVGNTSGSIIYLQEGSPVHGGNKSMKYIYKNDGSTGAPYFSEIRRNFGGQDWTEGGKFKGLVLFFKGDTGNDPEQMYVALSDGTTTGVILHPDENAAQLDDWQQWSIGFDEFAGVNREHIQTMYIGFGDRDSHPDPGGTGTVYFDDIRRYPPICLYELEFDFNDDCVVDFKDFASFAGGWVDEKWP
ncbi:MAG: hypothetical protein JXB29_10465 [Sedimentisphaerales bacterium]|nr:hypothetical protein [Sedimentisphaerales bacterium]